MIKEKIAPTDHPIMQEISHRWSPRAFSEKSVEENKLLSLLEAVRWAPSNRNEQPWHFIIARKGDVHYSKLFEGLNEWNSKWAFTAPVLIAVMAKRNFDYKNQSNNHSWYDVGLAIGNLLIQATHIGLSAHQMAGIYPEKIVKNFSIRSSKYDVVSVIALGYQDEYRLVELVNSYRESEYKARERKALKEFVFGEDFGKNPDWL